MEVVEAKSKDTAIKICKLETNNTNKKPKVLLLVSEWQLRQMVIGLSKINSDSLAKELDEIGKRLYKWNE